MAVVLSLYMTSTVLPTNSSTNAYVLNISKSMLCRPMWVIHAA